MIKFSHLVEYSLDDIDRMARDGRINDNLQSAYYWLWRNGAYRFSNELTAYQDAIMPTYIHGYAQTETVCNPLKRTLVRALSRIATKRTLKEHEADTLRLLAD